MHAEDARRKPTAQDATSREEEETRREEAVRKQEQRDADRREEARRDEARRIEVDPRRDDTPDLNSGSQWGKPTEPPEVEVSFEDLEEAQDELNAEDTTRGDLFDTQHTDGSTDNVQLAMDQGLVYTPPTDPPVVPSDDPEGIEIAAGFAASMEETDLDVEDLPDHVDDNDADLEDDIRTALHYNSETTHLDDVRVYVRNGIVYLRGTVMSDDDITIVDELVRDVEAVVDVRNDLEVAE